MESMDKNVTELLRNLKTMMENQATQKNALPAFPTPGVHGQQAAKSASGVKCSPRICPGCRSWKWK